MGIEQIKKYLKHLQSDGNLYSFTVWSDGSGALEGLQGETVCAWDDEDEMYQVLLSMCVPSHCAKETLLNFLGESKC